MRELLGWLGYAVFTALGLFGTALAVAWICVVVDHAPATSIGSGQLGQLRRCSAWWVGLMGAWFVGITLLARL